MEQKPSSGQNNENYQARDFVQELLSGPKGSPAKEGKKTASEKPKGVFGEKGISRSKFKVTLEKAYDPNSKINKGQRVQIEKEMPWGKYGDTISNKDVDKHLKDLKKEHYKTPHTKDKEEIQQKINLLNRLKNKKDGGSL